MKVLKSGSGECDIEHQEKCIFSENAFLTTFEGKNYHGLSRV